MTLRIPLTKDQTLQTEFHEIERRLRKLEKATGTASSSTVRIIQSGGGGSTTVNLTPIIARLDALEATVAAIPDTDFSEFGGVGETSDRGLVPAPGTSLPPTGIAQHLLTESGEWGFPLRGLIDVVTPGDATSAADILDIQGSLVVVGHLSAGDVTCSQVILPGDSYQLRSDQRGLLAIATEEGQTALPYDVVDINGGLHAGHAQFSSIEVVNLHVYGELDLDGGVP